jgi:hypothetical protein
MKIDLNKILKSCISKKIELKFNYWITFCPYCKHKIEGFNNTLTLINTCNHYFIGYKNKVYFKKGD